MKKNRVIYFIAIMGWLILPNNLLASGSGDHTHAHEEEAKPTAGQAYFSSEASSDKYELLIRYGHLHEGEVSTLTLFVSNYQSNHPIDKASIKISSPQDPNMEFKITSMGEGAYEISSSFKDKKDYTLNVQIVGSLGADLIAVPHIEVGKELFVASNTDESSDTLKLGLIIVFVLVLGVGIGMFMQKRNTQKAKAFFPAFLMLVNCLIPVSSTNAHGDDDHGAKSSGNNFSNSFLIPKETQFLFDVYTEKVNKGSFVESTKLFGTILPSSGGQALVSTPQNGRVASLKVAVGQRVETGQILATIEMNLDASANINVLTEKNNLQAEVERAKKDYDRLNAIQDIAAKRDVDEAKARWQKADANLKLIAGGTGKVISLRAPIGGIVSNFNLSVGSTVSSGQTLFTINNLSSVYAEAQVFDKDAHYIVEGAKFSVECANDNHKTSEVKLLSLAQEINNTNQSQRVLFELNNPNHDFKIGEFVNIRVFSNQSSSLIALPNAAFTEINGKPVVFIKEAAEKYSVSYVQIGENNGMYTSIVKGVEEGERIVVNGSYQLKMIYLNQ